MRVTVGNTVTFCMTLSQLPPVWKEAPFIRIIIPFAIGIAVADHAFFNSFYSWLIFSISAACLTFLHFSTVYFKYRYSWVTGIFIHAIFFSGGLLISLYADDSKNKNSILNTYCIKIQLSRRASLYSKNKGHRSDP